MSVKTSIRFDNEQYDKIKKLADYYGVSVTTFMRDTLVARTQDEDDYQNAFENLRLSHGKTVSRKAMLANFRDVQSK